MNLAITLNISDPKYYLNVLRKPSKINKSIYQIIILYIITKPYNDNKRIFQKENIPEFVINNNNKYNNHNKTKYYTLKLNMMYFSLADKILI